MIAASIADLMAVADMLILHFTHYACPNGGTNSPGLGLGLRALGLVLGLAPLGKRGTCVRTHPV